MDRTLGKAEVAANIAPFRPHVEASPRGSESSLLLDGPRGENLVSEVGAVPASEATPSANREQRLAEPRPGIAKEIRDPVAPGGDSLQRQALQQRAHDAIHSYLVEIADYDQLAAQPAYYKAACALEAIAKTLASKTRAEEGK